MKSGKTVVVVLLLAAASLGTRDLSSGRVAPKPASDCSLDEAGAPAVTGSSTDQMIHCWNR